MLSIVINVIQIIVILFLVIYCKNLKNKNIPSNDMERTKYVYKNTWTQFVWFVGAISIVALFISSFVMEKNITLEIMNEWVSLVLGLVALIMGVISLWLSFYNVEQATKSQEASLKEMQQVKEYMENHMNVMKNDLIYQMDKIPEQVARVTEGYKAKPSPNNNIKWRKQNHG